MSNYVILENVADERGESAAKVARTLFRLGCDLYLHLDESKGLRTCEVKYEVLGEGWAETKIVTPGYFPLLPESTTETIKRIGSNNFSIEGLIFVNKFEDGKTFNLRFGKDDSSVSIVAKKSDIDLLPPPSKYQTAPVSMYPTPPEKNNFKISEKNSHKKSNPELHNIFWRAFIHLRDNDKFSVEPQYKQVWETVYNELSDEDRLRENKTIPPKRKFDPHDHIEVIDPVNVPDPKLQWIISGSDSRISNQGTYSLSSLPPLLSKLKKKNRPPVIVGGMIATFAPELVISFDEVDMVCVGEGENALLDLADKLGKGEDYRRP